MAMPIECMKAYRIIQNGLVNGTKATVTTDKILQLLRPDLYEQKRIATPDARKLAAEYKRKIRTYKRTQVERRERRQELIRVKLER